MSKQSIRDVIKLLSYLKYHTDKDHPVTQMQLREIIGEDKARDVMGDKGTYSRRIREIADAYNMDDNGRVKAKSAWKLVYPGYNRDDESGKRNGKIYYAQPVDNVEMNFLIQQIRQTNNFTDEEKKSLEIRLTNALCSKYYKYPADGAVDGSASEPVELVTAFPGENEADADGEKLRQNISIIRQHIVDKLMVEMRLYDEDGCYMDTLRVSPYRMIYRDGYYWMIGNCHERQPKKGDTYRNPTYTDKLTSYRIDLLDKIETAHTPAETYVHWAMTHNALRAHSYTRINNGNRKTKARYNPSINKNLLEIFACEKYEHAKDI